MENFCNKNAFSYISLLLSNTHQTTDSLSIPKVGNISSQYGNVWFPRREYDFEEDVSLSLNKAALFSDRGRLLQNNPWLFSLKGRLLKNRTSKQKFALFFWSFRNFA